MPHSSVGAAAALLLERKAEDRLPSDGNVDGADGRKRSSAAAVAALGGRRAGAKLPSSNDWGCLLLAETLHKEKEKTPV